MKSSQQSQERAIANPRVCRRRPRFLVPLSLAAATSHQIDSSSALPKDPVANTNPHAPQLPCYLLPPWPRSPGRDDVPLHTTAFLPHLPPPRTKSLMRAGRSTSFPSSLPMVLPCTKFIPQRHFAINAKDAVAITLRQAHCIKFFVVSVLV